MRRLSMWTVALSAGWAASAAAEVKLPAIIGSHMVLQQKQANKIWGWAGPGEKVNISIAGQAKDATADAKGAWSVKLDPMPVGGPHQMTIKGANTINLDDILVGEVWVCSGQSNMQWALNQANDPDLETLTANYPNIRLISVPQVGTQEPQSDFKGQWEACTPATATQFSAVGYFFGRQLQQTLQVPIGLIDDAWGGSACEAWVRRDLLEGNPQFAGLMERTRKTEADVQSDAAKQRYEQALAKFKVDAEKAKVEGKPAPRPPAPPDAYLKGNARPGNIYNGVLKPTIGYGIKGAIWYQGESNASRAFQYRSLFPFMIKSWRQEWGIGDFSFYWVQLADFKDEKPEPVESDWAELREAQTLALSLPNTGQAVIIDIGEGKDIHPKNKQDVAKRLARIALAKDYGMQVPYQSPVYKSHEIKGDKVIVKFDHVDQGLDTFDVPYARGFAIAGEDKKFVWADAKVTGKDTVEVSSKQVKIPQAVRYAWSDNPICNLKSKNGLPANPFRTDAWPGITVEAQ